METVFTRILTGAIPAAILHRDERVFAFMDAGQVNPGHVLVATTHPYATLMDADEATAMALMQLAHRIALAVEQCFQPAGITLLQANRPAGWQTVPHLHMHVLPRHDDDGVGLVWPRKDPEMDVLQSYATRIQAAMSP